MLNKRFAERLNKELDSIGVPEATQDRINAMARLLKIPKFKAECLLNGLTNPDQKLLEILATELEVSEAWLIGKTDSKSH